MQQFEHEEKKSFWYIYAAVAVAYVILIIVYGVVVHNATENGAQDIATVPQKDAANDSSNANKMLSMIGQSLLATIQQ